MAEAVRRRPLLTVAFVAIVVAVGHAIWVWTHRGLGSLDPDEAGYLATALRYERLFGIGTLDEFVRAVGGTGFAPLVPLLSVPFLRLGPDDVRTAMLVQPALLVAGSVVVAGATARVAGKGAAVVAGATFAVVPTTVFAAQSYWFGLATGVAAGGAIWCLLASRRCTTRVTWLFGLCVALMLLSRTMSLGYVPALAGAAMVLAGRDRRAWRRLAEAAGVVALVAGPWWFVERETIFGYLTSYGYGETAAVYGGGPVLERVWYRIDRVADAVGVEVAISVAAVAIAAVLGRAAQRWVGVGTTDVDSQGREAVALGVAAVGGLAALVSTSNSGVWFELPLVIALFPLAAMAIVHAPAPWRALAVAPVVGMAVVQTAVAWWLLPPTTSGVTWLARNHVTATQQEPAFVEYDLRFAADRRGEHADAAEEWWSLTTAVVERAREIERDADGPVAFWLSGSMELFNANTAALAEELDGRTTPFYVPETRRSARERSADLTPMVDAGRRGRAERVLVIAVHSYISFPPDHDARGFAAQARRSGWTVSDRFAMPGHGVVLFLRHSG